MRKDKENYKILVIEDNPGDYTIVEDLLFEMFLNPVIVHADNFKKASALLSVGNTVFDIILLDLTLPDKSGQRLITEMLEAALLCPIIILTGYHDINFSIEAISKGILDYLLKDELNAPLLYKSIIYSIERKKTISELEISQKRYSDLFHLSPQPMWVSNVETLKFVQVNDAAISHYGYSQEEFSCMTIVDISQESEQYSDGEEISFSKKYNQLAANGVHTHLKKNGELIQVEIHCTNIYSNNLWSKLVLANDITENRNYIKAIEGQNKKLQEIAWTQSHVVRAPLARMLGIVNLIKDFQMTSQEGDELLNHFVHSGTELDVIIQEIVKKTERISMALFPE